MSARKDHREQLEREMQRVLSELPLRQAPASLERRVIEAIEERTRHSAVQEHADHGETAQAVSALGRSFRPHGFASWPLAARAALIAACLTSAILVVLGLKALAIELARLPAASSVAGRLHALREAVDAVAGLGALLVRLVRMIPPAWLLSGIFATALIYAMLFALVAIGYSTLYTTPERSRS